MSSGGGKVKSFGGANMERGCETDSTNTSNLMMMMVA